MRKTSLYSFPATKELIRKTGELLKFKRECLHLSKSKLAELSGISRTSIIGWENGTAEMSFIAFLRMCEALEISQAEINELWRNS